ncbi:MAG: hypothetical protein AAGF23_16175, partial [Acidobacteriota bacterium]
HSERCSSGRPSQNERSRAIKSAKPRLSWGGRPEEQSSEWLAAVGADGVRDLLGDPELHVPEDLPGDVGSLAAGGDGATPCAGPTPA